MMEVLIEVATVYVRCSYRHHQLMRTIITVIVIINIIIIMKLPISLVDLNHNSVASLASPIMYSDDHCVYVVKMMMMMMIVVINDEDGDDCR